MYRVLYLRLMDKLQFFNGNLFNLYDSVYEKFLSCEVV